MAVQELIKAKKYKLIITYGYVDGKRLRYFETFYGGKKEAELREAQIKLQLKEGSFVTKKDITIKDLSVEYLSKKKNILAPSTYVNYEYRINVINSKIGHIKLCNLNVKILESFYDYLYNDYKTNKGNSLSHTTIQHYYLLINNMLEQAIIWDYLSKNPNAKCEKPKRERNHVIAYSIDEVHQLLDALTNEPLKYQAIIYLALDTGCRRGELTGLTWDDISFKTGSLTINKSSQYVRNKGIVIKETKSLNSDRKIYISPTTINILRKYKVEQEKHKFKLGSKWENSNQVFTTDFGGSMHPDTPSKIFEKIIKKYGLRKIKFHALRHTSISLMIREGVQSQIISRKSGHSSIQVTHAFYSDFFDDEFQRAADVMDNILNSKAT